jgi:CBS domain-containing protein
MKVRELIRVLPTLHQDSSLKEAINIFRGSDSDVIIVLGNKRPTGVLSAFEALEKIVEGARFGDISLIDLMNPDVLVIDADTEANEAAETMLAHMHWMAIVTEKGEYKGVVTAGCLVKVLV